MRLMDNVKRLLYAENPDTDKEVETFIQKEYFGLMQLSCLYLNMDSKFRLLSVVQLSAIVFVLSYHAFLLIYATFVVLAVDMVLFCQSVHFTLLNQLTLIVVVLFQVNRKYMRDIHRWISSDFYDYKEPVTEEEDELRSSVLKEQKMFIVIPVTVGIAAFLALILAPIVDNNFGTFDFNRTSALFDNKLPYSYIQYPYSTETNLGYYYTFATQIVMFGVPASTIGSGGFLFLNIAQSFTFQIKKLLSSLDRIEERAEAMCRQLSGETLKRKGRALYESKHFQSCYNKCFKKNFEHHQIIIRSFECFVNIASFPIILSYITGTIVIALSLVSTGSVKELPGTTLASMVLCGVEVGYMYLFSFFGQRFEDMSQDLRLKFYCIKWYYCRQELKKSLFIIQTVNLRPLEIKAGGIVPVNMETFTKVMNSAYSYYNLVVAFGKV